MGDIGFLRGLQECARHLVVEIDERQDTGEALIEKLKCSIWLMIPIVIIIHQRRDVLAKRLYKDAGNHPQKTGNRGQPLTYAYFGPTRPSISVWPECVVDLFYNI